MINMKPIYISILCALLLFCCENAKNPKKRVKLEILNKELYFNSKYVNNHSSNQCYKDNIDRAKATNILIWKITNLSEENYLFIVNEDDFFEDPFFAYNFNHIEITDIYNKKRYGGSSDITLSNDNPNIGNLFGCYYYNDSIRKSNYKLKGGNFKDYEMQSNFVKNSFVLHPNESKTFQSIIRLPILKEVEPKTASGQITVSSISEYDKFNIIYEWDSIKIKKALQYYQIKELKENKVKIYSGILRSNKVFLKRKK